MIYLARSDAEMAGFEAWRARAVAMGVATVMQEVLKAYVLNPG